MSERILVVDNEERMCKLIRDYFELDNLPTDFALNGPDAFKLLKNNSYTVVITDLKMTPVNGLEVLNQVKKNWPSTEVILITAYATQETALQAMKDGAYDYLIKPFKIDELALRVQRIINQKTLEEENRRLKEKKEAISFFEGIIGKSKKMRQVFELIEKVADRSEAVLIRGESGTGKELIARAVHQKSSRKQFKMISVNCAALPENLLESELFGYEKGAFTGADQQKAGLIELANRGTLFLDEIGDLSLNLQSKLLRVLQNKEIIRVGGSQSLSVDIRLVTATHRDLEKMIEEQNFRSDLYYRINMFPIILPPLRERKEDLPELIEHSMKNFPEKVLSPAAKIKLMEYDYPGNIRELENIISRAAIISDKIIENVDTGDQIKSTTLDNFQVLLENGIDLDEHITNLLRQALEKAGDNKTEAAKLLGITRRRLYSMMESYNVIMKD